MAEVPYMYIVDGAEDRCHQSPDLTIRYTIHLHHEIVEVASPHIRCDDDDLRRSIDHIHETDDVRVLGEAFQGPDLLLDTDHICQGQTVLFIDDLDRYTLVGLSCHACMYRAEMTATWLV